MTVDLPPSITLACYNKECTNVITLRLDSGYYKFKMYDGECSRCGIRILIERFSPFLNYLTNNIGTPKVNKVGKPIQRDNPNFL